MIYTAVADSDIGTRYATNQDSLVVKIADTSYGNAVMAILCDGMGGLTHGELASTTVVMGFSNWFMNVFRYRIESFCEEWLYEEWNRLVEQLNTAIYEYGKKNGIRLGTTITGGIFFQNHYYLLNIGDSRVYGMNKNKFTQMTMDHSYVADKIRCGELSEQEAKIHPKKNCITRCIGAREYVKCDFYTGLLNETVGMMLCSDGFYARCPETKLKQLFSQNRKHAAESIKKIFGENAKRGETDNMSVVLLVRQKKNMFSIFHKKEEIQNNRRFFVKEEIHFIHSENYIPLTMPVFNVPSDTEF